MLRVKNLTNEPKHRAMKTEQEIKKICSRWLIKAFDTGIRQSPTDANNSEFYAPMIDLSWSKKMTEEIMRT